MNNQNDVAMSVTQVEQGTTLPESTPRPKQKRGFAAMDPNLVRELARKGGVTAHRVGKAHQFSPEEARAAGRKGGLAAHLRASQPDAEPKQPS